MGAREVSAAEAPELHGIVERLCVQAELPMPRLADRRDADAERVRGRALAVERRPSASPPGCWTCVSGPELEGVLAHELTHVANRDVMLMTIASFFASIASFIVQIGFWFGGGFGGSDNDDDGPGFFVVVLVAGLVYVDLVLPDPGAVALPRVRRRPRLGADHRPAERAVVGAAARSPARSSRSRSAICARCRAS